MRRVNPRRCGWWKAPRMWTCTTTRPSPTSSGFWDSWIDIWAIDGDNGGQALTCPSDAVSTKPMPQTTAHTIAHAPVPQIVQGVQRNGMDVPALPRPARIAPALLGAPLSPVTPAPYAALLRRLRRGCRG